MNRYDYKNSIEYKKHCIKALLKIKKDNILNKIRDALNILKDLFNFKDDILEYYDLNRLLKYNYYDFVDYYGIEYFQCFIINEKDLVLFKKYCNYDIQYDHEKDLYILCIDHLGTSWYMINTKYSLDNLMNNYMFENLTELRLLLELFVLDNNIKNKIKDIILLKDF